ncbi:amidohydrolase family protein [Streptomyces sp. N2-109]|uniref:Amidohydrolase family protein n=1 Tax=Streptomyces gossypii TaxID=2883101 RepID=A0ABT2JM26_9ACTN|nr:amidohydrolase family protein [Streptomyces gossypii]MCT2588856.1 amidohydrolase family protein [Streptomyces gossypii]
MRIVDAHHHLWDLSVRDQAWITGRELTPLRRNFTLEDLTPELRAAHVRATVVVQTVTVAEETPELLRLAAGGGAVAGVVGWTDLASPQIADRIEGLRELPGGGKLAGIRHQVQHEPDPEWLVRPDVLRGLRALAEAGLAYDLVIRPHQLRAAYEAAAAVPALTFVLDHLAKPPVAAGELEPWARAVRAFATLPNTACKLSGLVTEAAWDTWSIEDLRPYADTVVRAFGPDRVMFGSDWPVCLLAASYPEVVGAAWALTEGLGTGGREAVFSATATRIYGL